MGRLGGLRWLSVLELGVEADVPDVQRFGISGRLLEHLDTVESPTSMIPGLQLGEAVPDRRVGQPPWRCDPSLQMRATGRTPTMTASTLTSPTTMPI